MSKKIDEVYTDNPSAGNDPSVNYKYASTDGTTSAVALDMDQLANAVAVRIGTSPPPNPTEDLNQFVVSILDNTLTANIQAVTGVDYTHWVINVSDATTPTYPDDFTNGPLPATKSVAADPLNPVPGDWGPETWYPWVYDLPTTTMKALNNPDGTHGTEVIPKDTAAPVWLAGTAGFDVNDVTLAYTIVAPTDNESGLRSNDTYTILDDGVPLLANFTALTGTLTLPEREDPYLLTCQATDNYLNTSESDQVVIDRAPTAANGTIAITAASFEGTEGNNISVTISWDGVGTTSIDVDTAEGTASDTTTSPSAGQFTRKTAETVNWTSPGTETVIIATTDRSSATNNQCFLQLDFDSRPPNVAIGREVCEVIINSSASGDPGYTEQTDGTDFYVVIEAEETTGVTRAVAGDDASRTWADESDDRCLENVRVKPNNVTDYGNATTLSALAASITYEVNLTQTGTWEAWLRAGNATGSKADKVHLALLRPVTSIGADGSGGAGEQRVTLPANHGYSTGDTIYFEDVSVAGYNNTTGYVIADAATTVFDIPNTGLGAATGGYCFGEATLLGLHNASVGVGGTTFWDWVTNDNVGPTQRTFSIGASGAYKFRVYQQEYAFKYDRICLASDQSGTFDADTSEALDENSDPLGNGNDDFYGYTASTYSAGGNPVDNSDNTTIFPVSLPATTISVSTLSPVNGATANQDTLTAIWTDMTGIIVNSWTVTFGGSEVSGSFTYGVDRTTWTPDSGNLPSGVYTVDSVEGRGTDNTGTVKALNVGTWGFTIVDPAGTGIIYQMDLSPYPVGTALTRFQAADLFNNPAIANGTGADAFNDGRILVETDPFGSGQKVLSVLFKEGLAGHTETGGQWKIPFGTGYDDVYMSAQYGVDTNWICPKGIHLPILTGAIWTAPTVVTSGVFANFHQCGGNNAYISSIGTPVHPDMIDNAMWSYIYHQDRVRHDRWANLDDPTALARSDLPHSQPRLIPGQYVTYETRMEMNTPAVQDGACQSWWQGQLCVNELRKWRDLAGMQVTQCIMGFHLGGNKNNPEFFAPQDQKLYLKSFTISENPISHV